MLNHYRQTQQYEGLETYLATVPAAQKQVAAAGALTLLHYYQQARRSTDAQRIRKSLDPLAAHDVELLNFLRFWDAEQALAHFALRGVFALPKPAGEWLRLAAASGTLAARPACGLLQLYEPNCRCVLPADAVPQRPTARRHETPTPAEENELYPNPAGETVTARYRLPTGTTSATLVLSDLLGRQVLAQPLDPSATEATVAVWSLPAGFYQATWWVNGRAAATRKLAIAH